MMMDTSSQKPPKVSVFISSYNHARYLPDCLDSILAQTYTDFEVVVVDDGSSDDSHALLSDYQERYPDKVRYFYHEGHANRGISISCNLALEKTRGAYLAWCGSDDVWLPEKLAQQVQVLDSSPEIGLVYGRVDLIDSQGNLLPGQLGLDIMLAEDPVARLLEGNWVPASTAVFRRACLEQVGTFDETLVYSDWDLWIRILSFWKSGFLPAILGQYRLHNTNISVGIDPKKNARANIAVLAALWEKSAADTGRLGSPRNRALIALWLAYYHFRVGDEAQAAEHLQNAFQTDPTLCQDRSFVEKTLGKFAAESYNNANTYQLNEDFALHVLEFAEARQIPLTGGWRKQLAFLRNASKAVLHYQNQAPGLARSYTLKGLRASPAAWLRCSPLRGILLETLTGRAAAERIRRAKRWMFLK